MLVRVMFRDNRHYSRYFYLLRAGVRCFFCGGSSSLYFVDDKATTADGERSGANQLLSSAVSQGNDVASPDRHREVGGNRRHLGVGRATVLALKCTVVEDTKRYRWIVRRPGSSLLLTSHGKVSWWLTVPC